MCVCVCVREFLNHLDPDIRKIRGRITSSLEDFEKETIRGL